jgi:hypothetical protein
MSPFLAFLTCRTILIGTLEVAAWNRNERKGFHCALCVTFAGFAFQLLITHTNCKKTIVRPGNKRNAIHFNSTTRYANGTCPSSHHQTGPVQRDIRSNLVGWQTEMLLHVFRKITRCSHFHPYIHKNAYHTHYQLRVLEHRRTCAIFYCLALLHFLLHVPGQFYWEYVRI